MVLPSVMLSEENLSNSNLNPAFQIFIDAYLSEEKNRLYLTWGICSGTRPGDRVSRVISIEVFTDTIDTGEGVSSGPRADGEVMEDWMWDRQREREDSANGTQRTHKCGVLLR